MKMKTLHMRPRGRVTSRQVLAITLALACVITCTVGAIIGATFAAPTKSLQGLSPASVSFGDGTLQAYLEENLTGTQADVPDTLNLTIEATRPPSSGGGGGT